MEWYPFVGYGIFWLGLIASIILFAVKRKWHPVLYLVSVCLYIFTVCYVIDVFDLSKNATLGILALSAIIMMGLGYYLSTKFKHKK